jgi:ATP-binding cassette subfamily B (MDR/TAP) protein 1
MFVTLQSIVFGSVQAGNVFTFVPDISESSSASNNILRLLDNVPEIDAESSDGKTVDKVKGRIEFKNTHFRYPTRPAVRVLRDFSLTIEPGTHVALVGASGCGKSTVIQLIERFYDPLHGEILVSHGLLASGDNEADVDCRSTTSPSTSSTFKIIASILHWCLRSRYVH